MKFFDKIHRRLLHLRLRPIRVFCIHQVSDVFNPLTTYKCDWIPTEVFKSSILNLKKEYTFISLSEAHRKLQKDLFRCKEYAVLTADDGYCSILNILPWLEENNIPITLFLNARYLDGQSCSPHIMMLVRKAKNSISESEAAKDLYLTESMVKGICSRSVSLASHGYEHLDASNLELGEFVDQIRKNVALLSRYDRFIPFHAYTWGRQGFQSDAALTGLGMVPVYMDGLMNYNNPKVIHRELLPIENKYLNN